LSALAQGRFDVAVIKIAPIVTEYFLGTSRHASVDARDRLICVSLGDSNAVIPGSFPVQALGFPSTAFNPSLMAPDAAYRVSRQNGQIDQIRPMKGGWNAFEMTARIYHDDSGGPVLDRWGSVISSPVTACVSRQPVACTSV
jgi:hypothetical protein